MIFIFLRDMYKFFHLFYSKYVYIKGLNEIAYVYLKGLMVSV